jgi:CRP-like cAMP-binding protein
VTRPETELLRKTELFRGLDDPALGAALALATRCPVPEGTALFKQGDAPRRLFVALAGRFSVTTVTPEGVQLMLRFMEPGDLMGCAAVFRQISYPGTATATVDSVALSWPAGEFQSLVERHPRLAANALAIVGGRAEYMLQRLSEVTASSAEQRIAQALLRLAREGTEQIPAAPSLPISRQQLAELSATTLYTVSRTVSAWARAGLVESGRNRVAIQDFGRLRQIARARRP